MFPDDALESYAIYGFQIELCVELRKLVDFIKTFSGQENTPARMLEPLGDIAQLRELQISEHLAQLREVQCFTPLQSVGKTGNICNDVSVRRITGW
jgi:hypothetical protein